METALSVANLKKSYGSFMAVDNINFNVKKGEIFGLLGPNGAGKSTTLECIEGIKKFDSGTIEIFNESIKNSDIYKSIGIQLQSSSLQKNITVMEAMTLFCKWRNVPVRRDLIELFGLNDISKRQYCMLSTGQKRRLHLAIALVHNPKLLVLDEPTAGLDVEGQVNLKNEIKKLKDNGTAIILASHDMTEVEELCDRIAILIKGRIAKIGTPEEIRTAGCTDQRISIKTVKNTFLSLNDLKFSKIKERSSENNYSILICNDLTQAISEIIDIVNSKNDKLIDLRVEHPSLEERFIELVNESKEAV